MPRNQTGATLLDMEKGWSPTASLSTTYHIHVCPSQSRDNLCGTQLLQKMGKGKERKRVHYMLKKESVDITFMSDSHNSQRTIRNTSTVGHMEREEDGWFLGFAPAVTVGVRRHNL